MGARISYFEQMGETGLEEGSHMDRELKGSKLPAHRGNHTIELVETSEKTLVITEKEMGIIK